MKTELGTKLAAALKAITDLHSDTSRLLSDCDKHVGKGRASVFGSYATKDLTWNFEAEYWMAAGVYRYYQTGPESVIGVTVAFLHRNEDVPEPIFIAGKIDYTPTEEGQRTSGDTAGAKRNCKEWDLWYLYFDWGQSRELGQPLSYAAMDRGRIKSARIVAVPLMTVRDIENVIALIAQICD